MKSIKFKDANTRYAENQDQYETMHALKLDSKYGEIVTCWELSFWERVQVLFTGKIWLSLMMFGKDLTPSFMSVKRKDVYSLSSDKEKRSFFTKWL